MMWSKHAAARLLQQREWPLRLLLKEETVTCDV
jgi:hypothetical protein